MAKKATFNKLGQWKTEDLNKISSNSYGDKSIKQIDKKTFKDPSGNKYNMHLLDASKSPWKGTTYGNASRNIGMNREDSDPVKTKISEEKMPNKQGRPPVKAMAGQAAKWVGDASKERKLTTITGASDQKSNIYNKALSREGIKTKKVKTQDPAYPSQTVAYDKNTKVDVDKNRKKFFSSTVAKSQKEGKEHLTFNKLGQWKLRKK